MKPSELFTVPEVAVLLVLTALPVPATVALRGWLTDAGLMPVLFGDLAAPLVSFALYALCSWVSFAGVVCAVGWSRLRAHGLRVVSSTARLVAAAVALLVGIALYRTVESALLTAGLTGVEGMNYARPTVAEAALLLVSAVGTAAFCEEVFFRVIWIGVLGTRIPRIAAAVLGILVFSIIHYPYFGLGGVVFVSVWAVLPSVLFLAFRDITAPLLLHVSNNAFAYLVVPLWLR